MCRAVFLLAVAAAVIICMPVTAATSLSITALPAEAHVGDTVALNGSISGTSTIAVYLFLTGPGLDPRGVTLDNLNIAAGRGLFTTAPVYMKNGTWNYLWDTSVIVGDLKPGTYTISVVASPLDRLRSNPQETASAQVNFSPADRSSAATPVSPLTPLAGLGIAAVLVILTGIRRA